MRWWTAAITTAAFAVLNLGLLAWSNVRVAPRNLAPDAVATLHFETRHGEQQTRRLPERSVLHVNVAQDAWPAAPKAVDAHRTNSWLHRQIMFDHEPLSLVASEFNRYASKPFEITTPALRDLIISGVFATDDTDAFIAFLRSLEGVRVEVTATRIQVSRD